jgi:hypothetical protein
MARRLRAETPPGVGDSQRRYIMKVICSSFIEDLGYEKVFVFVLCIVDSDLEAKSRAQDFTSLNKTNNWYITIRDENDGLCWTGESLADGLIGWEKPYP